MAMTAILAGRTTRFDRIVNDHVLAAATLVLLAVVAVAVTRRRTGWTAVPRPIWLHLATIALPLAPAKLLQR